MMRNLQSYNSKNNATRINGDTSKTVCIISVAWLQVKTSQATFVKAALFLQIVFLTMSTQRPYKLWKYCILANTHNLTASTCAQHNSANDLSSNLTAMFLHWVNWTTPAMEQLQHQPHWLIRNKVVCWV